jgi:hypothetical protein
MHPREIVQPDPAQAVDEIRRRLVSGVIARRRAEPI